MSDQALSETELATHIEGLAGCEARRDVAERLAADAYADGARTIADLGARWPEDGAFFADYAAAAEDAGTPIDFAQDTPEVQPEPVPEPDSEREPLTIEEAILRECPGMGASAQAISYATGMKEEHIILAAEMSPLLFFPYGRRGATGIAFCNIIRATEAGRARAAEMGGEVRADIVAQVAEMDAQEEVADAEMDAQEQEANRLQEMLAGQTLPARVAS